jgi:hypothetical protein
MAGEYTRKETEKLVLIQEERKRKSLGWKKEKDIRTREKEKEARLMVNTLEEMRDEKRVGPSTSLVSEHTVRSSRPADAELE